MGIVEPPIQAVHDAVRRALAEDVLPLGDLSASLVPASARARFTFVARREGVIAGSRCAIEAFALTDPDVSVVW
ncbi:MAG: nicotinate-nucleotide diphosphorylase (carboxylating), partial [Acidimicrobiales bacterium]